VIELSTAAARLALALAFGAAIGVEREWRQKHAGLKTMALVAIGAAAFAMMSNTFPNNNNPGQIAAAVVGGIGFIGAGVIMHRGATVQGVTTAATLWADASVGVAVGLGQYAIAAVLTAGIVLVQFVMRTVEKRVLHVRREALPGRFELRVECDGEALHQVNDTWRRYLELVPLRQSVQRGAEALVLRVILRAPAAVDICSLEELIIAIEGVRRVDVRHLGVEEEG
jgi:uncharacterized membrane protein YhiD involved in acid resistance